MNSKSNQKSERWEKPQLFRSNLERVCIYLHMWFKEDAQKFSYPVDAIGEECQKRRESLVASSGRLHAELTSLLHPAATPLTRFLQPSLQIDILLSEFRRASETVGTEALGFQMVPGAIALRWRGDARIGSVCKSDRPICYYPPNSLFVCFIYFWISLIKVCTLLTCLPFYNFLLRVFIYLDYNKSEKILPHLADPNSWKNININTLLRYFASKKVKKQNNSQGVVKFFATYISHILFLLECALCISNSGLRNGIVQSEALQHRLPAAPSCFPSPSRNLWRKGLRIFIFLCLILVIRFSKPRADE